MRCAKCQTEHADDARFCGNCGASLAAAPDAPTTPARAETPKIVRERASTPAVAPAEAPPALSALFVAPRVWPYVLLSVALFGSGAVLLFVGLSARAQASPRSVPSMDAAASVPTSVDAPNQVAAAEPAPSPSVANAAVEGGAQKPVEATKPASSAKLSQDNAGADARAVLGGGGAANLEEGARAKSNDKASKSPVPAKKNATLKNQLRSNMEQSAQARQRCESASGVLQGRIKLAFEIADGKPVRITLLSDATGNRSYTACIAELVEKWRFTDIDGEVATQVFEAGLE